jgi:hypothetical protein
MSKYYVSICLIINNDHAYIREWLDYHKSIGVDHFYITDNKSEPPLKSLLSNEIEAGIVTYRYDTRTRPQVNVYNECIKQYKNESKWIAFIDSDEFLVFKRHSRIQDFLKDYESFGAVSIAWYLFGSNGHFHKQTSVIRSYTTRVDQNSIPEKSRTRIHGIQSHFKTIIQPLYVLDYYIHCVVKHVPGYFTVDEKKRPVEGPFPNKFGVSTELSQLNHYIIRSHEDFQDKSKRTGGNHPQPRPWDFFFEVNFNCKVRDTQILNKTEPCQILDSPPKVPCDPSNFNWIAYLINNPDVAVVNCTQQFALTHWYKYGKLEKRSYQSSIPFNWNKYTERYPHLNLKTEEAALKHYITVGRKEGKDAS